MPTVHPTAHVSADARIGASVTIGAGVIVYGNVTLGDGCTVDPYCIIGEGARTTAEPLVIGSGARIRSHSVLYCGSTVGNDLVTGHHVVMRERSRLGNRVQIGAYSELQGDVTIGDDTRTQSSVFIPKHCRIGRYVWLMPRACLTNDPHPPSNLADRGVVLEDFVVVCAGAMILPGLTVHERAVVAAMSLVTRDVERGMLVAGVPARPRGPAASVSLRNGSGKAYPWTRHFHRGYPADVVAAWQSEEE